MAFADGVGMNAWMAACVGWLAGFSAGCLFVSYLVKKVQEADAEARAYSKRHWDG